MAKPTKIVVHFDDGTTTDIPAQGVGSIFMNEGKAKKCGHNPPYGPPPHSHAGGSGAGGGGGSGGSGSDAVTLMSGSCYMVNGVIVCP
jgi:hypothetical protein